CPEAHRAWLAARLQYAHEPNLRRRLRETLEYVGPGIDPLIPRPGKFVQSVVNTRNDLTHWDPRRPSHDGESLYGLAVILGYVVDGALLRCLGLSEGEVAATFGNNEHFGWAVGRFAV